MKVSPVINSYYNNSVSHRGSFRQGTTKTVKGHTLNIAGKNYTGETTFEIVKKYTLDKFYSTFIKHTNYDIHNITPETRYYQDLGADSIDIAEMVSELEYATGYEISDDIGISKSITIQDFVDFIDSHGSNSKTNAR